MAVTVNKLGLLLTANQISEHALNLNVKLFKNNFVPTQTSVIGDFIEADFDDYAAESKSVDSITWDAMNLWAVLLYHLATFTKGAGSNQNTIFGWYATLQDIDTNQKLYMHDIFSPAQGMMNEGDQIKITAKILFKP